MNHDRSVHWYTDNHGRNDVGDIMVGVAVVSLILISGYDVGINHHDFKPQDLGIGVAAIIAALGAYKYGDSKSSNPNAGG